MSAALNLPAPDAVADEASMTDHAIAQDQAIGLGKPSLLHLLTCGSVDDDKSTLLGRLLFDSHAVLGDQLTALDRDSRRFGTQGQSRDFALLVDGLSAEREQGITIDVAYRYFSTERRAFIVADTPDHEQYTRNMATGASTAELAIILVDARKGILSQTRRHSYIVAMLGVRHVVLAVNKMDLVGFASDVYDGISDDYRNVASALGFASIVTVPICAREGDNIAARSARTPWYDGPVLLDYLETVPVTPAADTTRGFRFPVQWVNRPSLDFRGYGGTIASGVLHAHQPIIVLPSRQRSRVATIVTADGLLETASAGQAVTLTLANEVDVSRGDIIVPADEPLAAGTDITARVLWMAEEPVTVGQSLLVKLGTATANARVARLHHAIDIHSFSPRPAAALALNEIGVADLVFDKALVTADYTVDRALGALVLIDRPTNQTVALGVVEPVSREAGRTDAGTVPAWRSAMLRMAGSAGSRERWQFWQIAISRLLVAVTLAAIVVVLSRDAVLALVVALAELALRPILGRLVGSEWQRWSVPPPQTYEWGEGI